ncbi:WcaI family glycosyltransferase [Flavobacterium sp. ASW18X]|uniref:WcaI family glycosyltransferase n=1 Tax=Flavobacterium sp. ASW18X TaxID=2572595 RepID=UPI0010AE8D71|nr:WcaI family glycosyltransferase [Flavobacterium sp. ASW18X]TKD65541.1 colanic acid biosynthesis glycosyltransferase WcaI [Flavobacterium sp. ASW18X]
MNTKKRILLIGYNFAPELTGIGKYSGEMMEWLAQEGHDCKVLTAYPYYPYWKVQAPYRSKRFWYTKEVKEYATGGKLTVVRCPMYVPSAPSGLKRILVDTSFSITASLYILKLLFAKKYDWVLTVAPSFQFGLLGVVYKGLKNAKLWYHIQDLQIEAAQDLGMITNKAILKVLFGLEGFIFKQADVVSSISDGMLARIAKKTKHPLTFFPNWTETEFFKPIADKTGLKSKFGGEESDFVVLYSGAIGEKQGLEAILTAAQNLKSYQGLQFIICGTGPYKAVLQEKATQLGLDNLRFLPLQPKEDFNAFLNMADLHLVIQKEKASDLVMPSKLTTILAVGGVALVTANPEATLHKVIQEHHMGILVKAEDQGALEKGIAEAYATKNLTLLSANARGYAEAYLNKHTIMQAFEAQL